MLDKVKYPEDRFSHNEAQMTQPITGTKKKRKPLLNRNHKITINSRRGSQKKGWGGGTKIKWKLIEGHNNLNKGLNSQWVKLLLITAVALCSILDGGMDRF